MTFQSEREESERPLWAAVRCRWRYDPVMSQTYQNLPPVADGAAVVITGTASGIGLAAARRFADLGLPVVLARALSVQISADGNRRSVTALHGPIDQPVPLL